MLLLTLIACAGNRLLIVAATLARGRSPVASIFQPVAAAWTVHPLRASGRRISALCRGFCSAFSLRGTSSSALGRTLVLRRLDPALHARRSQHLCPRRCARCCSPEPGLLALGTRLRGDARTITSPAARNGAEHRPLRRDAHRRHARSLCPVGDLQLVSAARAAAGHAPRTRPRRRALCAACISRSPRQTHRDQPGHGHRADRADRAGDGLLRHATTLQHHHDPDLPQLLVDRASASPTSPARTTSTSSAPPRTSRSTTPSLQLTARINPQNFFHCVPQRTHIAYIAFASAAASTPTQFTLNSWTPPAPRPS